MSNWVSNGPCPQCGSKDNLATYDDGHQWCWGCGHYVPGDKFYAVRKLGEPPQIAVPNQVVLPHDVDTQYPQKALDWITKYELTRSDLHKNRVLWSDGGQLLIFSFTDGEGRIIAWQGRNFGEKFRTKWYGRGQLEDTFVFFPRDTTRTSRIIFVEDIISALKLGNVISEKGLSCVAMPIFGSHVSKKRLSRCLHLLNDPPTVTYWLDKDKAKEAVQFASNARSLGFTASTIITELDPKEISYANLHYHYINSF